WWAWRWWWWWWATPVKSCLDLSTVVRNVRAEGRNMRYVIGTSGNLSMNNYHRLTLVLAIALALGLASPAFGAAVKQKTFASAEEGVKAPMEAVKKSDTNATLAILGPEAKSLIESGDQVSDRAAGERFVKSYEESNKLAKSGAHAAVLEVEK